MKSTKSKGKVSQKKQNQKSGIFIVTSGRVNSDS